MARRRSRINVDISAIGLLFVGVVAVSVLGVLLQFIFDNIFVFIIIGILIVIGVIVYALINSIIKYQRNDLMDEILDYLDLNNIDSLLKPYDISVPVKSKQTLDTYDRIKFLKENDCFDILKDVVRTRNEIRRKIEEFLSNNEFEERPQYNFVSNELCDYLSLTDGYRARIVYITSAGNNKGEKLICFDSEEVRVFEQHPEWLMTKLEYNKMLKEQGIKELEDKKRFYYDKVNSIIDFSNNSKDSLIVKNRANDLDKLIQLLFDRTINSIQKIKRIDSEEWGLLDNFISSVETLVHKIVEDDIKISQYYASEDFAQIKEICNSLNVSRKDFNEYIEEKANSISKLFGTRIVRN